MCLKQHTYYVCNCKNPSCPQKWEWCCFYAPRPSVLNNSLGHLLPYCDREESTCPAQQQEQRSALVAEPCPNATCVNDGVNVGLCEKCKTTCGGKQKSEEDMSEKQKADLEKKRKRELLEWHQRAGYNVKNATGCSKSSSTDFYFSR